MTRLQSAVTAVKAAWSDRSPAPSAIRMSSGTALKVQGKSLRFSGYGGLSTGGSSNWHWLRRLLPGSHFDYEAEAGNLWKNGVVAIALEWIRKNFPEPELRLERRKGDVWESDPEATLLEWLEEPNGNYDNDTLWAASSLSLNVDGNAYWYREKNTLGREFYTWIPHWQMRPCWPSTGKVFISHYEYTVDGIKQEIPIENVIHYRTGLDPENERLGLSALKALLREVVTDNQASTYTAAILRNMGVIGMLVSPEDPNAEILDDDRKDLKKLLKQKTGEGAGEPVINSVSLKIQEFGATPEKLTLDKIRQLPEARIAAAIGVLPMTLGLSVGDTQKTYSNQPAANRQSYQNCLIPMQKSMAKQLQRQLAIPLTKGSKPPIDRNRRRERLRWDYSDVQSLREDQTEVSKRAVIVFGGGLAKRNEARAMIGLATDPDGDKFVQDYPPLPSKSTQQVGTSAPIGDEK